MPHGKGFIAEVLSYFSEDSFINTDMFQVYFWIIIYVSTLVLFT